MSLIREPILIVKCPICKSNDWRDGGPQEFYCNKCEYKFVIKRKDDYKKDELDI